MRMTPPLGSPAPSVLSVIAAVAVTAAGTLLAGCSETRVGAVHAAPVRAVAVDLPFEPEQATRLNDRNDGSTFEPCVAYQDADLLSLNIDPATMQDLMPWPDPVRRGCAWAIPGFIYMQGVTDIAAGAPDFNTRTAADAPLDTGGLIAALGESNVTDHTWEPTDPIDGRVIALYHDSKYQCGTVFETQDSIVITLLDVFPAVEPEICAKVIAFTELAVAASPGG